jgi:acyl-CoA thioester hydrolase
MNDQPVFATDGDKLPDEPLAIYQTKVLPEWIDYNGHMNVAFYVLAFDKATDEFFNFIDVGIDYVARESKSFFVLETHVNYIAEVKLDDPLHFTFQLIDWDEKRLHYYFEMFHAEEGYLAATSEQLGIHVNLATRRAEAMPQIVQERLGVISQKHQSFPRPDRVGGGISIRRKS